MLKTAIELNGILVEVSPEDKIILEQVNLADYTNQKQNECPTCNGVGNLTKEKLDRKKLQEEQPEYIEVLERLEVLARIRHI